jgi:tetratricopeptide (TPR) repeat protein
MPEEANYYDSKGEILLMKGDEQEAVKMWQKVLELDPDFLSKHDGGTPLYGKLKEKGLIEQ